MARRAEAVLRAVGVVEVAVRRTDVWWWWRQPSPRSVSSKVSTQVSVSNGRGKSIRGQISCSPMCWLYVVIIGSSPTSCCIFTIEPIGSSIQSSNRSRKDFSGGRSFLISGSPSQQWNGTRSGVPRSKAIRVRSAVFTVVLLCSWSARSVPVPGTVLLIGSWCHSLGTQRRSYPSLKRMWLDNALSSAIMRHQWRRWSKGAQAIDRAARILARLVESDEAVTLNGVMEDTQLPKSTAARLLRALERNGLAQRRPGGGFRPGPVLVDYARGDSSVGDLATLAWPYLEGLNRATGETTNIAIPTPGGVARVAQVDSTHPLGAGNWVGRRIPIHASSMGKVFMAFGAAQPPFGRLAKLGPGTITSIDDLLRRARGGPARRLRDDVGGARGRPVLDGRPGAGRRGEP